MSECSHEAGAVLVRAVDVSFAHADRPVLQSVSLDIRAGEFCALVGGNGSGKTTFLRLLLDLWHPQHGHVEHPSGPIEVGYVPQRTRLDADVPATVHEIVATGLLGRGSRTRRKTGVADVLGALTAVGLADRAGSRFSELSGGQQQRVLIARALVRKPDLLILDEPVAGVDAASQDSFRDIMHRAVHDGAGVLLVSHELGAVQDILDRVVVLRNGRIDFDGPPKGLSASGVSLGVHAHDLPVWLER
jgi:zinc transport system ATP-binding protein